MLDTNYMRSVSTRLAWFSQTLAQSSFKHRLSLSHALLAQRAMLRNRHLLERVAAVHVVLGMGVLQRSAAALEKCPSAVPHSASVRAETCKTVWTLIQIVLSSIQAH